MKETEHNPEEQNETTAEQELQQEQTARETAAEEEKDPVVQLQEELAQEKDKFLRLFAEFENYKKRTLKERMDLYKTAGQEVMVALLPVMDDFDRALSEIDRSGDAEMFKGVELIQNKFKETLKSKGLEEMKVVEGDAFDAEIHEALTQIPAPNKKLKGKVLDVVEKGYTLGEKIIRHPKVVVGQ
jgi:molecular chaperone GrpE